MTSPVPVSVVIIASNEADRIEAAIRSAAFASEVLVVESGSRDATVSVARAAGARVVETDWPGFAMQKQRGVELAGSRWVLSIDADEQIPPELAKEVRAAVEGAGERVAFAIPRSTWWQGRPMRFGTWSPDARYRLFRTDRGRWVGPDPHDHWEPDGPVGALKTPLQHRSYRNLDEHLRTVARYAELQADALIRQGARARWWDWALRPWLHLVKALFWKSGVRDGPRGVAVAFVGAAHVALKWALVASRQGRDEA